MKNREVKIDTPQGPAGSLENQGKFSFKYLPGIEGNRAISLKMPVRPEAYKGGALFPVISMNMPEGFLLEEIKTRLNVAKLKPMEVLPLLGGRTIGRLSFGCVQEEQERLSLNDVLKHHKDQEVFEALFQKHLFTGISGVQPKTLLQTTEETRTSGNAGNPAEKTRVQAEWIVKYGRDEYPFLVQNEYLCLKAAEYAGLTVPEHHLSESGELLLVKRFDYDQGGQKLGFEDMAALRGLQSEDKYTGSYEQVVKLIGELSGKNSCDNLRKFYESLVLSVMVRNGDAHLKNFGLLYEHPGTTPVLAPIFDVVSTGIYLLGISGAGHEIYDKAMALKIAGSKNYPAFQEMEKLGRLCQVEEPLLIMEKVAEGMEKAIRQEGQRIEAGTLGKMKMQWELGGHSLLETRVNRVKSWRVNHKN